MIGACVACEGSPMAPNDPCAVCGAYADELTALRTQVSELRADLEVACEIVEDLAQPIPLEMQPDGSRQKGRLAQVYKAGRFDRIHFKARATLNTIRKDG